MDINQLYQTTLGRDPSAEASTFWQEQFAQDPAYAQNAFNAAALEEIAGRSTNTVNENTNNTNNNNNSTDTTTTTAGITIEDVNNAITSGLSSYVPPPPPPVDLGPVISGMNTGFNGLTGTVNSGFNNLTGTVNSGFSDLSGTVNSGFDGLNTNMSGYFQNAADARTAMQNQLNQNMTSGFNNLNTNMGEGFNNLNTNIGAGFEGVGQGLNQLNTNNQAAFDNMSANFAAAADARTAMQTALLNGQTNLSDQATGIQNNLNTYFQSLTDGQNNMTGRLGALQTGQDDFREAFDRQSTIQNRTAGDLADSVSGGFNSVNRRLSGMQAQGAGQAAAMNVAPNASGFSPLVPANTQAQDFNQAAVALAQGTTSPQADPTASRFVQAVNAMRQMSQNPQLNPAIRSAFADVSSSFDPNGRLVPNMTLPDGSRMARAIANGALNVRQFDAMGNTTRAQQYDLNQMIGMLQG